MIKKKKKKMNAVLHGLNHIFLHKHNLNLTQLTADNKDISPVAKTPSLLNNFSSPPTLPLPLSMDTILAK